VDKLSDSTGEKPSDDEASDHAMHASSVQLIPVELFDSADVRAPAHELETGEVAMVDRFLDEFADYLPPVAGA
jgi:hypothetical protein